MAVDLGAGTGKMSRELCARGWHVHAVEPARAMREQLTADATPLPLQSPDSGVLYVHDSSAEDTGLPDACADLVIAAQAWHWFDAEKTSEEAARLLRLGGLLAIVFNQMDVSVPWVHRLTRIMRSGDVHRHDSPPPVGAGFCLPHVTRFDWQQEVTTHEVMELGRTRSSWLRQDESGRARMQENLRWYLHEHLGYEPGSIVTIPYSTFVWTSRIMGEGPTRGNSMCWSPARSE